MPEGKNSIRHNVLALILEFQLLMLMVTTLVAADIIEAAGRAGPAAKLAS